MGRPRLPADVKARRGTLRKHRERGKGGTTQTPRFVGFSGGTPLAPLEPRDYGAIASGYMAGVLDGSIVACAWVRLAVERQDRDLRRAADDPTWPYVFSSSHAAGVCAFVERLPHVEGHWPTATIRLAAWQCWLLTTLYGWRHRGDLSRRRYTSVFWQTGRKSAKSTIAAGLALYHLLHEDEPGASVVCGATTGAQARVVFGIAQRMVRRAPWLRDAGLQAWAHAITHDAIGGSMRPVNAKAQSLDGLNPSCIVLDESHAQTFELHDVLKSSQGARRNPLLLCPTTAGHDLLSVGYALRTTTTKILQGIYAADHVFGVLYGADEGDGWRDARTWQKANPSLGTTPTIEWVRTYATDAEQTPGLQAEFRTKVCCEWLQSGSAWLDMGAWDRCADPSLRLDDFAGARCWIGADLAALDDLAAVALVFARGDLLYAFVRCYLPADVVAERARAVPAYREWADAGRLVLTDGNMIDFARIERDIRADCRRFKVADIVFDQYGSIQIAGNLSNSGLPARIEPKNASTFTAPARELETRVKHARLRHDGDSLLKWAASNVVVTRRTDDSLLPKKETAESPNKIDPIDATLQAIGGWLRQPAARKAPVLTFV
jgi:phage terminase large subunit-like protein